MAAPVLESYQQSTWTDRVSTNEATASVTWAAGDLIVVIGLTEDQSIGTLALPTAAGLRFAQAAAVSVASSGRAYVWWTRAGASGSGAITSVVNASAAMRGLSAFVYSGSGGLGNISASSSAETVSVRSLTRAGANSAMIFGLVDWSANADVTVTAEPSSGSTIRINTTQGGIATMFVVDWTDQGTAGTADCGISAFAGVTNNIMVAVEVLGSPSVAVTGTATATINETDVVAGGKTIILTTTNDTIVPAAGTPTYQTGTTKGTTGAPGRTNDGDLTVSWPTGYGPIAGDLALIVLYSDQGTGSTPSGWAEITGSPWGSATPKLQAFWKVLTGSEGTPVTTISGSTTNMSHCANVAIYSGLGSIGAIGTASAGTGSPMTAGAITTTADNSIVLGLCGRGDNESASTQTFGGSGTGVTEQLDGGTNEGNDSQVSMYDKAFPTSGTSSGNGSAATSATDPWVSVLVELKPSTPFISARAAIASGLDSGQSESAGWDAKVKPNIPVANVVRTSNTVITVTLHAQADYDITAQETITATVPASALVSGLSVVASPTFTVDQSAGGLTEADGAATGTSTPSGVGVGFALGTGSITGTTGGTVAAVALWNTAADAAGIATDSTVGAAIGASAASAAGVGSDSIAGAAQWNSAASAAGTTTADSPSGSTNEVAAASAGIATDSVVGVGFNLTAAESTGIGTLTGVGVAVAVSVYGSSGVGTALGEGDDAAGGVVEADGASAGIGTPTSIGVALWVGIGASTCSLTADAVSGATAGSIYDSAGIGTPLAVSGVTAGSVFDSSGLGSPLAIAAWLAQTVGTSEISGGLATYIPIIND